MASQYRYVITYVKYTGTSPYNNSIIAELPFTGVNFTKQLNSIGTFQGHLLLSGLNTTNLNVYEGTEPGKVILWVYYGSSPIWSGVIWHREWNSENQTLSITAQEMMSLYQRRRISTTKTYTSQDPTYIAQNLLQYTEALTNGGTNLQYSVSSTAYTTSKTYNNYEYKSVYQAIKDLSQNYFDFRIYPTIVGGVLTNYFQAATLLGSTYSNASSYKKVLELPGNLVAYTFPEDGFAAANKLYGLGYGANSTKLTATYVNSNATTSGFPLLEDSANYIDIGDINLLKDVTKGQGDAIAYPPLTMQAIIPSYINPVLGTYDTGDEFRIIIQDDLFPNVFDTGSGSSGNTPLRCVAIDVSPGENGPDRVTLTLTRQLSPGSVS